MYEPLTREEKSSRTKILLTVFLTILLDFLGYGMYGPTIHNVALKYGAPLSSMFLLNSLFALGIFVSSFFLGRLSDTIGRKIVLIVGCSLTLVAQLCMGFTESFIVLALLRFLHGAGAGNVSVAQACIADVTSKKDRGKFVILIGIAIGLGFMIGPALGNGVILVAKALTPSWDNFTQAQKEMLSFQYMCFFGTGLSVLNLVVLWSLYQESSPHHSEGTIKSLQIKNKVQVTAKKIKLPFKHILKVENFPALLSVQFLHVIGFSAIEVTFPIYLEKVLGFNLQSRLNVFTFLGSVVIVANGIISAQLLKKSEKNTLIWGLLCFGVGFLGIYQCQHYAQALQGSETMTATSALVLYLPLLMVGLGASFVNPALVCLVSSQNKPENQGWALSLNASFMALAKIFGPMAAVSLYKFLSGNSFVSIATLYGLVALFSYHAIKVKKEAI